MKLRTTLLLSLALVFGLFATACDRGNRPPMVGQSAPDFTVKDDVKSVTLSQYRGKTVVLNFWATWCPPCVEEMPSLANMQRELKDKNVVVIAVSTDQDTDAYKTFIQERNIDFSVLDAAQKSNRLYGSVRFPETFIIDKNGTIRRKFIGAVNWTRKDITDYLTSL